MGDYSDMEFHVPRPPEELLVKLREIFEEYSGGSNHYNDDVDTDEVRLGANDVRVGSVEDLAGSMDSLREGEDINCWTCKGNGDEDCATCNGNAEVKVQADLIFQVNDSPKYEWLGNLFFYVPGLSYFSSDCDDQGQPVLSAQMLSHLVEQATDLVELKAKVNRLTGTDWNKAVTSFELTRERHEDPLTKYVTWRFRHVVKNAS